MGKSWREKRAKIKADIIECFAARAGITAENFMEVFFSRESPARIGDFNIEYLGGEENLEDIFSLLSARTGIDTSRMENHYHRDETLAQFGEHLLRAGAYRDGSDD